MKIFTKLLGLFLISSLLLVGCKKENTDDEPPKKNSIIIGDREVNLADALLVNAGPSEVSSEGEVDYYGNLQYLYFVPEGSSFVFSDEGEVSIDQDENAPGSGTLIIVLFSSKEDELDTGVYNQNLVAPYPLNSFLYGVLQYSNIEPEYQLGSQIMGGNISVSKNGDEYSITYDCTGSVNYSEGDYTTQGTDVVTGFYRGTLKYYDQSE